MTNAVSLPSVPSKARVILWILLLSLTAGVSSYPVRIALPDFYQPVQTPMLYSHIGLFAFLYFAWIGILAYLLASSREEGRPTWEQLALVLVLAFTFLYYWNLLTPHGKLWDEPFQLAHARYLEETGKIAPDHPTLNYLNFPGIHLIGATLKAVTQRDIFLVRDLFTLVNVSALSSLLYLLYTYALGQGRLAAFGVMVTLHLSPFYAKYPFFFPSTFALTLMIMALVFVYRESTSPKRVGASVGLLILFATLPIAHFITAVVLLLTLGSMKLLSHFSKSWKIAPALPAIVLAIAILSSWLLYVAVSSFGSITGLVSQTLQRLATQESPISFISAMQGRAARAVGGDAPLWTVLTVLWWTILLAIIVPLLWLRCLWRIWRGEPEDIRDVGWMLGIVLVAVIAGLSYPGGIQVHRYWLYGPIPAVPLLFRSLSASGSRVNATAIRILLILTISLSFPTFLAYNNSILTDVSSAQDWAAAGFANNVVGKERLPTVFFANQVLEGPYVFYDNLLNSETRLGGPNLEKVTSQREYFERLQRMVDEYLRRDRSLYIWSRKVVLLVESYFDVSPSAEPWQGVFQRLSSSNSLYDNGNTTIYSHQ